jgi:hypothetical protein
MTVRQFPGSSPGRPLTAFIGATERAVDQALSAAEPDDCLAIARLSGHLAAMWRTVYPQARGRAGTARQLRADCLASARRVEWTLRLLECQLSGEASVAGQPLAGMLALLAERLDGYRSAERALVGWLEESLAAEGKDKLAGRYRRALGRAPTRPHPRSPREGPLRPVAFWLHGRWDRLLDTVDSRPGAGDGFPGPLPAGRPSGLDLEAG